MMDDDAIPQLQEVVYIENIFELKLFESEVQVA